MKRGAILCLLLVCMCLPIAIAHGGEEETEEPQDINKLRQQIYHERSSVNDMSLVLPWTHFMNGNMLIGLIVTAGWLVGLRSFYILILMIFARDS